VTIASHSLVDVDDARTALAFVTDHRPGALHRAIAPLAEAAIDLERLVSRPQPESPFRYRFDAVMPATLATLASAPPSSGCGGRRASYGSSASTRRRATVGKPSG
jgi:hypothetical protein